MPTILEIIRSHPLEVNEATAQDIDELTLRMVLTAEILKNLCFVGVSCTGCGRTSNILVQPIWTFQWKCSCGDKFKSPQLPNRWAYCHEVPNIGPTRKLINDILDERGLHGLKC